MTVKIVVWQGLKNPFFALEMKNLHLLVFASHLSGYDIHICCWFLVQNVKT